MADNYLEKQYEAYEARKAAWEKKRKYGTKHSSVKKSRNTDRDPKPEPTTTPHS